MSDSRREHCLFGFPDYTQDYNVNGGAWHSDFPATHMQETPVIRPARSTNLQTSFTLNFVDAVNVQLVGFCGHTLSITANITLRGFTDANGTQEAFNIDAIRAFPRVFQSQNLNWNDPRWWRLTYSQRDIKDKNATRVVMLERTYRLRKLQIDIDDHGNPNGFFDIGYLAVAGLIQFAANFSFGAKFGLLDESQENRTSGGVRQFDVIRPLRQFSGAFHLLPQHEAFEKIYEMLLTHGRHRPILFSAEPSDLRNSLRTSYLARFVDMPDLTLSHPKLMDLPFNLQEAR